MPKPTSKRRGRSASSDARLLADEALEVAAEALAQLGRGDLAELEPNAAAQRVVEAALEEAAARRRGSSSVTRSEPSSFGRPP